MTGKPLHRRSEVSYELASWDSPLRRDGDHMARATACTTTRQSWGCCLWRCSSLRETLIKSVTPAEAGVQCVDFSGFRRSPE